jgi:hypothetical protein
MADLIPTLPRRRKRDSEANLRHQRAFQQRRRGGMSVTRVRYDQRVINMLINEGWLSSVDSNDPVLIADAIESFLNNSSGGGWR